MADPLINYVKFLFFDWLAQIYAQDFLYNDIFPSFPAKSTMRLENGKIIRPLFSLPLKPPFI
jgi:hypothetical protein